LIDDYSSERYQLSNILKQIFTRFSNGLSKRGRNGSAKKAIPSINPKACTQKQAHRRNTSRKDSFSPSTQAKQLLLV
jgi:hypothetical protein